MNKRQVIIFWIVALILGGAVTALKFFSPKETLGSTTQRAAGQTLLASFPATEVATVEIQGAGGTVTLVRKAGKWTLAERDGYPANGAYVNDFLRTLGELKVTRAMEAGPSFAPRFGMDESSATARDRGLTATFKDATGNPLAKISLGKTIESGSEPSPMGGPNAVGRYVRNHADASGFYAVSEMFPSVSDEAPRWLANEFISPEKIKTITVSHKAKDTTDWKLTRENESAEFKLEETTGSEVLDATVAAPLKSVLSYARFEDVVPGDKVATRADVAATRKVTLETVEGFTYSLSLTPAKAAATPPPPNPENPQPPAAESCFLTVSVSAQLPKERKKEDGEKPEDATAKDSAFRERLKALTDKLAKEQAFAGRTFEISKSTVDALLKDRADLITKATPPPPQDPNSGSVQKLPGGLIARPPIEAVTPPISVPPVDPKGAPEDAGGK